MSEKSLSRKKFITQSAGYLGVLLGGAFLFAGCRSNEQKPAEAPTGAAQSNSMAEPASCNDLTGLSEEELKKRQGLGYVDKAPSPDSRCEICKLYLPPAEGEKCGGCSLFKGFVDKKASCTYFAALDA